MKLCLWSILLAVVWVLGACTVETTPTTEQVVPTDAPSNSPYPAAKSEHALPAYPAASGDAQSFPAYPISVGNAPTTTPQVRPEWTAQAIREATAEAELRFTDTPVPDPVLTPVSQGVLLREVWQQQGRAAAAPPTLLYALARIGYQEHTFWRVGLDTLTQPEQLTAEPQPGRHLSSSVSSDGHWLAYTLGPVQNIRFHVMRTDGSERRLLDEWWRSVDDKYAWSPVGNRLLFSSYEDNATGDVEGLYLYDADLGMEPQRIGERPWTYIIGWLDAQHVLLYSYSTEFPLRFETLNVDTGVIQPIATTPEHLKENSRWSLSPDRQRVLLRGNNTWAVFDLATATFRDLAVSPKSLVWAPDSQHVLYMPSTGDGTAALMPVLTDTTPITLSLMPNYRPSSRFTNPRLAPDGSALVVNEYSAAEERPYVRTLVYDVWNDRWVTLASRPQWGTFLGWIAPEGQQ
jgi:hypothetical protein